MSAWDCGQKRALRSVPVRIDVKPVCKPGWQGGSSCLSCPSEPLGGPRVTFEPRSDSFFLPQPSCAEVFLHIFQPEKKEITPLISVGSLKNPQNQRMNWGGRIKDAQLMGSRIFLGTFRTVGSEAKTQRTSKHICRLVLTSCSRILFLVFLN